MQWRTIHAASGDANCTVRLGQGLDTEDQDEKRFITLIPKDGSADSNGAFPCGRTIGYDYKEFKLPSGFTCDKCTLQLEWTLGDGSQIH